MSASSYPPPGIDVSGNHVSGRREGINVGSHTICRFNCGRNAIRGRDVCLTCDRLNRDDDRPMRAILGVPEDEPIFVLRAQDKLAPEIVREWITRAAASGASIEKLQSAMTVAEEIEAWQVENPTKVPD